MNNFWVNNTKHIGWIVWWKWASWDEKVYDEFKTLDIKGISFEDNKEYVGEDYMKHFVEGMRQEGKKYSYPIVDCGYEKVYVKGNNV